ncbi:Oligopeptide transport system permease protein AppC [[Clostridium] ultunense Esp]|nr:Oligopeptide transport system permease protein AppC [[Clostridium] ultunense Esp]
MGENKTNIMALEMDEDSFFSSEVESFWMRVWRRFRNHKLAMFGTLIIVFIISCSILAPVISPFPYDELHLEDIKYGKPLAPNSKYWFGTDNLGRDYLTRCIYGGRVSLIVAFGAVVISLCIGVPLGCLAGYYGGVVDMIICRIIEILTCIPTFFLILTVNAMFKPSIFNVMICLGVLGWMGIARQIRAQFLSLRNQDFVQSAIALGIKDSEVIFRHLLPNALMPVVVNATMRVASNIMMESALSYLGLGVQEPTPSWGAMLKVSQSYIKDAPWMALFPGILISVIALALNFAGDGLRDALDPRTLEK